MARRRSQEAGASRGSVRVSGRMESIRIQKKERNIKLVGMVLLVIMNGVFGAFAYERMGQADRHRLVIESRKGFPCVFCGTALDDQLRLCPGCGRPKQPDPAATHPEKDTVLYPIPEELVKKHPEGLYFAIKKMVKDRTAVDEQIPVAAAPSGLSAQDDVPPEGAWGVRGQNVEARIGEAMSQIEKQYPRIKIDGAEIDTEQVYNTRKRVLTARVDEIIGKYLSKLNMNEQDKVKEQLFGELGGQQFVLKDLMQYLYLTCRESYSQSMHLDTIYSRIARYNQLTDGLKSSTKRWTDDTQEILGGQASTIISEINREIGRLSKQEQSLKIAVQQRNETKNENKQRFEEELEIQRKEINRLREMINISQDYPTKEMPIEQDGQIIYVDIDNRICFVNKGRVHGIKSGMIFKVYQDTVQRFPNEKGRIVVKEVFDQYSRGEIVIVRKLEPIVEGHIVDNPIFHPARPYTFLVGGTGLSNYLLPEFMQVVRFYGGKFERERPITNDQEEIGDDCDVLVVGIDCGPKVVDRAKAKNMYIITEKEFFERVGRIN